MSERADLTALREHYRQEADDKRATLAACEAALATATGDEAMSLSIRADRTRELLTQCELALDLLAGPPTYALAKAGIRADFWEHARRRIDEAIKTETDT